MNGPALASACTNKALTSNHISLQKQRPLQARTLARTNGRRETRDSGGSMGGRFGGGWALNSRVRYLVGQEEEGLCARRVKGGGGWVGLRGRQQWVTGVGRWG